MVYVRCNDGVTLIVTYLHCYWYNIYFGYFVSIPRNTKNCTCTYMYMYVRQYLFMLYFTTSNIYTPAYMHSLIVFASSKERKNEKHWKKIHAKLCSMCVDRNLSIDDESMTAKHQEIKWKNRIKEATSTWKKIRPKQNQWTQFCEIITELICLLL